MKEYSSINGLLRVPVPKGKRPLSPIHWDQTKELVIRARIRSNPDSEDSRVINIAIERERHPIPTIDELIADMTGATVFSKIDLNKGYHQLELHPDSRPITTFRTHQDLYRYKRLSFGINSAVEIFHTKNRRSNPKHPRCQEHIGWHHNTYQRWRPHWHSEDHIDTLKAVFARLRAHNLTVNKDKCIFGVPSLEFFGHVYSATGVTASDSKLSAIIEAESPITVSELRNLLGMAQYVARLIPNYGDMVAPLQILTHKDHKCKWREEQEAFRRLKCSLAKTHTHLAIATWSYQQSW